MLFAVSYGYLEYYYINDPVQGKTANLTVKGGTHRVTTPIVGGLYSYHIYIPYDDNLYSCWFWSIL